MSRISRIVRTTGRVRASPKRPATTPPPRLATGSPLPRTPGLIATGPGLAFPRLHEHHWQFSGSAAHSDGALFAANLLRAGVASPEDWECTRQIGRFLQRTVEQFAGRRATGIDRAFDISLCLSTTASNWRQPEEIDPHRVLLTFRVAQTVSWVNLTPVLDLLKNEHELLPAIFYSWLSTSMSRWFRVFDVQEARCRWDSWIEMRQQDEDERKEEWGRAGVPFEPGETLSEPALPRCIGKIPRGKLPNVATLTKSAESARLMDAAQRLYGISRSLRCPKFDSRDQDDLYDCDAPIPLIALAFGEHDVITEFLNMELETSGQVENEPWPILTMDGTNPASIRLAFRRADVALNTLEAASQVLSLVPGFEPLTKGHQWGGEDAF